jgi:glycerol kinase
VVAETTALGAAYAAGLAVGVWKDINVLRSQWKIDREWEPTWSEDQRESAYAGWKKAVEKSLNWVS